MEMLEWKSLVNGESIVDAEDINKIANYANELNIGKVDKVSGMGLSSNDFTDDLKTRLENNTFDDVYYYEDNPFGGEGAVNDELRHISQDGIYKIFHNYRGDYVIGILKVGHYDVEGDNGTYQIFVTMDNDVYRRFDLTSDGWEKISVSQTDLDNAIGDIETSLENIIQKYGLGGDGV